MSIRECKSTRASVAVAILLVSGVARAATGGAPLTISHSGYLLDGTNTPLSSATLSMKFRFFDQPSLGNLQWEGACATVQVARGYYTVLLGSAACVGGTANGLDPVLDTSDLPTTGARWLEVELGGVTMSPRMAVATVPTAAVASRALTAALLGTNAASDFALVANLKTVATSGSYNDLLNLPTLGALAAKGSISNTDVAVGAAIDVSKIAGLETVATSGSYNDLLNQPTLGALAAKGSISNTDVASDAAIAPSKIAGLKTVATSGSYNDLTDKPTQTQQPMLAASCDPGYVAVPQTALPDGTVVPAFCVMKYEAKYVLGSPESNAAGLPWVSVTWTAAKAACTSVGKHLITENEWLALAHNAVNVASNWTSVTVGTGAVYSGHNDGSTSALAAGADNDGYNGTGNTAPSNQRRTLTLSNGSVVWDLAGNVWEWTDATLPIASRYHGGTSAWMTYYTESGFVVAANVPAAKRPPSPWNAMQGMGRYYDGSNAAGAYNSVAEAPDSCGPGYCASQAAFLRGGSWNYATVAGVFALYLNYGRAYSDTNVGFRCAGP